jgi:hypothetical protein
MTTPSVEGGWELGLPKLQFINPATGEVVKEIQVTPDMVHYGAPPEDAPRTEEQ